MRLFSFYQIVFLVFSFNSVAATKVAFIMNLQNDYSKFPQDILKGTEFSLVQYDKKNIIHLKSFSHEGDLNSIEKTIIEAKKFGPDVIIAGETSQYAMLIAREFRDKIFITPTASSIKLNLVHPAPIRMIHSDEQYAKMVTSLRKYISNKRIGIIHNKSYPNTDYISEKVRNILNENKYKFEVVEILNDEVLNESKLKVFIDKKVEVVFIFSFETDLRRVYGTLVKRGVNPLYIGADGWGRNHFLQNNLFKDSNFKGLRALYWYPSQADVDFQRTKASLKNYLNTEPDDFHAIGHDLMKIILDVLYHDKEITRFYENIKKMEFFGLLTTSKLKFRQDLFPLKDMYIYSVDAKETKYQQTIQFYE